MIRSALRLAALLLLVLAPATEAASLSDVVPVHDAADGVSTVRAGDGIRLRFGPKAAGIYRTFAGRRVHVGCTKLAPAGEGRFAPDSTTGTRGPAPRRRSTLETGASGPGLDFCTVAVDERKSGERCVPPGQAERNQCLRLVVAHSLRGRLYLARLLRVYDLVLGFAVLVPLADIEEDRRWPALATVPRSLRSLFAALPAPDAMPPAGRTGYWTDGRQVTFSVLDLTGRRLYFRVTGTEDEPVISTNVPEIAGPELPDVT